jgi:hypothetical protein
VLTAGTGISALCLVVAFVLSLVDLEDQAASLSAVGIVVLLATPAAGLVATWAELRRPQPSAAVLALVVLGVLAVAVGIALTTRA